MMIPGTAPVQHHLSITILASTPSITNNNSIINHRREKRRWQGARVREQSLCERIQPVAVDRGARAGTLCTQGAEARQGGGESREHGASCLPEGAESG